MTTARMLQRLSKGWCEAGEERWAPVAGSVRTDIDGITRGLCQRCHRLVGLDRAGQFISAHKFQGKGA